MDHSEPVNPLGPGIRLACIKIYLTNASAFKGMYHGTKACMDSGAPGTYVLEPFQAKTAALSILHCGIILLAPQRSNEQP
jgi:hypothetical protein